MAELYSSFVYFYCSKLNYMEKLKLDVLFVLSFLLCFNSCETKMDKQDQINKELIVIDSLLRDTGYAFEMAKTLDAAYFIGIGETPGAFLALAEDTATITKSLAEEKVATNLAGFYALECGIGVLCEQANTKPTDWLEKITAKKTTAADSLLLNRFANATWKASQPFRSLKRIKKDNFIGASFLSAAETDKDAVQITNAATKLLASMQDVKDKPKEEQMKKLRNLLQNKNYAFEMAAFLDSAYYLSQSLAVPPFLTAADDTIVIVKNIKDQKIATSIAGFYALECGLNYFVTTRNEIPSDILKSIVNGKVSQEDIMLFSRFANATWKAGQPFRGLERITRDTFTPFYFLNKADVEKDMVQIKAAAKKLLESL